MAIRPHQKTVVAAIVVIAAVALIVGWGGGIFTAGAQNATFTANQTVITTDGINLRESASLSSDSVELVNAGTLGTILDGPTTADGYDWYQVDFDGVSGYAAGEFLEDAATSGTPIASPVGGTLYVNTDELNVRDAGSLDGTVVATLGFGDTVTDLGSSETADGYTWANIETTSGTDGWAAADYLTSDSSQLALTVDAVATVNADDVNLRDSATLSGSVVGTLNSGDTVTILSYSEAADGYLWYQVNSDAGTGWIAGAFLTAA